MLPGAVLGENDRLEDVRKDLELVTELKGYPFRISWESSAYSLIHSDGTVYNEGLTEGEIVVLTARFRCEEWVRKSSFMCRSIQWSTHPKRRFVPG